MDFSTDLMRLGSIVAPVPSLSTAFSLAIGIIKIVKISTHNTARIQYLAHAIVDLLVSIAEIMRGRWDNGPTKVKKHLDELEANLGEVLRIVKKIGGIPPILRLFTANDSARRITKLEKQLQDIERAIILLVGVDTSLAVNELQTVVNAYHTLGVQMQSEMRHVGTGLDRLQLAIGHIGKNGLTLPPTVVPRRPGVAQCTDKGPIIILSASRVSYDCAALVMKSPEDSVHIPLHQFTLDTAEALVTRIRTIPGTSLLTARSAQENVDSHSHVQGDIDSVLRDVLSILWRAVVQPILHTLNLEKSVSPPRLWWLPYGPFASLPIHAAGIYDTDGNDCVSDYVISSYTPSLGALLNPLPGSTDSFKMLVAVQPVTTSHPALPHTLGELRAIEKHVPEECLVRFGTEDVPISVEHLVSEIPTASIVHFACHGIQNAENPLESALLLGDDRLRASDLMQVHMSKKSMVFLSACQTAMWSENIPGELTHIAATLLFCGFGGAIATIWPIEDRDGPKVADSFYGHLFSSSQRGANSTPDITHAAHALHFAVAKLRAEGCPFSRWVPFIHLGL